MSKQFKTIVKSINSVRNTVYKPGDVIEIDIPASDAAVIIPKGTKLKFNLDMTDNNVCSQPDGLAGCWALIKNVQIFDLNSNTLLEQIDEANHLVTCQKHYSKTNSIANNWELQHGQCPSYRPNSLYYTQIGAGGNVVNNKVECVFDLQVSGILSKTSILFPNILVGGIRIRITLEEAKQCLTTYPCAELLPKADDAALNNYAQGCGGGLNQPEAVAPSTAPPANSYFDLSTALLAGANTVFVLKRAAAAGSIAQTIDNVQVKVGQYLLLRDTSAGAAAVTVKSGKILAVDNTAGPTITITCEPANTPVVAIDDPVWISSLELTSSYNVSNFELLVCVAEMNTVDLKDMIMKSSEGRGMDIDYNSWNIYRDNLQALVSNPQVTLSCTEHRALSLLQMPYNPNAIFGQPRNPMRTINDQGLNYQYIIASRNTPSRPVQIDRVSSNIPLQFNSVHGLEVEKAIERCNTEPRFMCDNNAYFIIGRALSRREHSFNANMNNIRLSILYSTAATANLTNKVLESQMYHKRRLNITNGTVTVSF